MISMKEPCLYRYRISLFEELLEKDKSVIIDQRHSQIIAAKFFKNKNGLNPEIVKNIFNFTDPAYHLRSKNRLERHNVKSLSNVTKTIFHIGPKIWNLLLVE